MRTIGFANKFYTLWDIQTTVEQYQSPSGQIYPSYEVVHYAYLKNVSTDIEKVKALYPTLEIDTDLNGKTRSFSIKRGKDLTPEILKFGKYAGWNINDLAKHDFDYLVKMIDECWGSFEVRQLTMETTEYIAFIAKKQEELNNKIASIIPLESGCHQFTLERNPDQDGHSYISISENHIVKLYFIEVKSFYYNGFEYYLPVFGGKSKRVKDKTLEYYIEIINTEIYKEYGRCYQNAKVLNIKQLQ